MVLIGKLDNMQDVLQMLQSQGYQQGSSLPFGSSGLNIGSSSVNSGNNTLFNGSNNSPNNSFENQQNAAPDPIGMLEAQGYREGGVLRFDHGGRPDDAEKRHTLTQEEVDKQQAKMEAFNNLKPEILADQKDPPTWNQLYNVFNEGHIARYGKEMNRPWDSDQDAKAAKATIDKLYTDSVAAWNEKNGGNAKVDNRYLGVQAQPNSYTPDPKNNGVFGSLMPIIGMVASFAFPEFAPFIQGLQGADAISHGDVLGGLAGIAGVGGYTDAAQALRAGKAIQSGDPLAMLGSAANISGSSDLQDIVKGAGALKGAATGNYGGILNTVGDFTGNQDIKSITPYLQTATKLAGASKNPQAAISALLASGSQKPVDLAALFPKGIATNPS